MSTQIYFKILQRVLKISAISVFTLSSAHRWSMNASMTRFQSLSVVPNVQRALQLLSQNVNSRHMTTQHLEISQLK